MGHPSSSCDPSHFITIEIFQVLPTQTVEITEEWDNSTVINEVDEAIPVKHKGDEMGWRWGMISDSSSSGNH